MSAGCGDCSPFVMLCPGEFDRLAERWGLTADEQYALLRFTLWADYRTGEISPITQLELGESLGWGRRRTRSVMDRLAQLGLVAWRFTRGHDGWLAVPVYLEVVRTKGPTIAADIRSNLAGRMSRPLPSEPSPDGDPQHALRDMTKRGAAHTDSGPQGAQRDMRPGKTPVSEHGSAATAPSSSYEVDGVEVAEPNPSDDDEGPGQGFADESSAYLSPWPTPPMAADRRCRHGRPLPCPYCDAGIPAQDYWVMVRWLRELRRKGKLHA